jgi:acetyl-CoA acetyltransferase
MSPHQTAAIAGIGATEFSKDSGRSELRLAVEAITSALADAGLTAADVDGLVTFTMDGNAEIAVARELGVRELRFFSQIGYGGGAACATVQHAAMAVATGTADVVVCYRALNERSGRRFGQVAAGLAGVPTTAGVDNGWHYPMGLATPAAMVAMIARRYMHDYGATSEDFGRVTVADRRHAASNPNAWFYQRPVTLAEHQESRWIAEPLRLLDCCQESDGAVAVVVTSLDRARDLPRRPAVIAAAAQGSGPGQYIMTSYYRDDLAALPEMGVVARQLWRQAGIGPADVRTAVLYDHFTPYVLIQLEELGFCPRGEARDFISGGAIEMGGRLPLNPHGGQLGEAYIHGMNGIAEAVRQVRGTSVNQVPGDGPVLVTAGTGVPTSGLILFLPRPGPSGLPAGRAVGYCRAGPRRSCASSRSRPPPVPRSRSTRTGRCANCRWPTPYRGWHRAQSANGGRARLKRANRHATGDEVRQCPYEQTEPALSLSNPGSFVYRRFEAGTGNHGA